MNKDLLESQWTQIREILNEKFPNLTEEDIRQINGRYDQLIAKLQQKYGYSREEAEERIRNWNFDRFATDRTNVIRDQRANERAKETDNTTLYKWLLGLGIPLVLLGAYLLNRPAEQVREPTITREVISEAPADRMISTNLRNALLSQQNLALAARNLQITTNNGVVTLSGTVPNAEIRDSIMNVAQNFPGIGQVINNIQVQ